MARYTLTRRHICAQCKEPIVLQLLVYIWPTMRHANCTQVALMRANNPENFDDPDADG
jgi:hypothetical protein